MTKKCSHLIGNKHAIGNAPNNNSFKKGYIPWNKGKKGLHLSIDTEFKKGRAANVKYDIGTITTRKTKRDGYRKFIKIDNPSKWEEHAKYVWKTYYNKILNGDVVHHMDGDRLNDSIENLIALPITDHPIFHNRWGLTALSEEQIEFYKSRYTVAHDKEI